MSVAVPMIVGVAVGVAVGVVMRMRVHGHIVRGCGEECSLRGAPGRTALVGNMTTPYCEFVDGTRIHCHHQKWHSRAG
jgi:hypothetical protein